MKNNERKSTVITETPTDLIIPVVKGAYEGYKTGGVSGAIAGGVKALLSEVTGKRWPNGAV